jgi:hypothetical protein
LAFTCSHVAAADETRVGLGVAPIATPTFVSSTPFFVGGMGTLDIDFTLNQRLGLHLSPMFGGGVAVGAEIDRIVFKSGDTTGVRAADVAFGAVLFDTQLRLHFTPEVSAGFGGLLGLAIGRLQGGVAAGFWFGPSITPVAVRLAEHHELSAWIGLPLLVSSAGVSLGALLPVLRYTYYF